jgi:hypothetical protein
MYFGACSFLGISKLKARRVYKCASQKSQKKINGWNHHMGDKKGKAKAFTYNDFEV